MESVFGSPPGPIQIEDAATGRGTGVPLSTTPVPRRGLRRGDWGRAPDRLVRRVCMGREAGGRRSDRAKAGTGALPRPA